MYKLSLTVAVVSRGVSLGGCYMCVYEALSVENIPTSSVLDVEKWSLTEISCPR